MTQEYEQDELPEGINFNTSDTAFYVYKNYSEEKMAQRAAIRAQLKMPFWSVNEDFVVSGMSGRFPESDSVKEFEYNLYNNIDMIVEDEKRWPFGYLGLPKGSGKIKDVSLFDYEFFHVKEKDAHYMDSQVRIMLEITFEALWDAGLDPSCLAGTNTGFFLGNCFDEYLAAYAEDCTNIPAYQQCFFAMLANVYDFRGPSKHFDTACASGFSALHEAMVSLRSGQCDRAIVMGLNLCLRAGTQNQFLNLNMISPDGHCKCLDDDANGYAKGEACVAIVLQKKSEAKRIYATLVHTKSNCDGYKDLGITYPSFELQRDLIEDTYAEVGIDPLEVGFCEAHCTGTQAGDPSEMRAIQESLCKGRTNPLLIGAIKSVIGHTEASSGLCSLVKCLLCFEHELIPANLHMSKINHRIEGLVSGILQPVTTNTPYTGKYIALNCFGFGGVNVHGLIRKHEKEAEPTGSVASDLPRLVNFCGRNPETLQVISDFMTKNPDKLTPHFLALLNDVSKTSCYPSKMFKGMRHRAYMIFDQSDSELKSMGEMVSSKIKDKVKPPVCFVFTGMGCQWPAMGRDLTRFPIIKDSLERGARALAAVDAQLDLMQLLTSDDPSLLRSPLNSFVAIAAIQIALVDFLESLEVTPDYIVGHSIGELVCAYADKCLSLEETLICAYWRGKCIEELGKLHPGAMAAIGATWQEALDLCNKYGDGQVWPACHNGEDSVTVSGSKSAVNEFLDRLQKDNADIFARQVNSSGIAFHCPLIYNVEQPLLDHITQVVKGEKRSKTLRWISTTYEENLEQFDARYIVDNLLKPVRFCEAFQQLPTNAVFVEIAPHHLLQPIIKRNIMGRSSDPVKYVATLSKQSSSENVCSVLRSLGALYGTGLKPSIEKLYAPIEYPVPRTTAPLHSLIQWKHKKHFTVTQYPDFFNVTKNNRSGKIIDIGHQEDKFLADHCVDGRILFPATGYLYIAWEAVAKLLNIKQQELAIVFEDVNLHRATIIPKSGITELTIRFIQNTGSFSIMESGSVTTTGKIRLEKSNFMRHQHLLETIEELNNKPCNIEMKNRDIYKEFRLRGYDYGPNFQSIEEIKQMDRSVTAKVLFRNWITFVDAMIQMAVLGKPSRGLYLPVRLLALRCDPIVLNKTLDESETKVLDIMFDGELNVGVAPGIEFEGIKANLAPRKIHATKPLEESFEFVPRNEFDMPYSSSRANSTARIAYLTEQLKNYQTTCAQLSLKEAGSIDTEQYEKTVSSPVLYNALQQLNESETPDMKLLENIEEDVLFRTYLTERFLRSQTEIATQNSLDSKLEVLEVNQTNYLLTGRMLQWFHYNTFKTTFVYRLLHPAPDKITSSQLDYITSQHEWLAEKSKFPTDIVNQDIVIFKDSSLCPLLAKHRVNFELIFESLWECLKDNRFALIVVRDHLYPVEERIMQQFNLEINNDSRVAELMAAFGQSSFRLVSHKSDQFGVHALLVRKITYDIVPEDHYFFNITNNLTDWFEEVQVKLREVAQNTETPKNVWLLANEHISGVIGLVSCLHREPLGHRVRTILNTDPSRKLEPTSDLVRSVMQLDLFTNAVSPSGDVGCYKHFTIPDEENEPVPVEHCFVNVLTRGDLSSLRWFESQHKHWPLNRKPNQILCSVYHSAMNFRDVMLATGKLPPDALPDDMGMDDCILGLEFAGRDENGNRVMGMVPSKGLATTLVMNNQNPFLWPIPAHWSMEEAATIPVAYSTAFYALLIRGKLQRKESVLIHSGSGAVGQAAISICLSYACNLFITVGSEAKREILMELFPSLKPNQFASSRDTNFETMILQATNGRGVDLVLNSLAEEKLQASVNCLAEYGRFLEIGKFDLSQDNKINIGKIMQNKSFHGILLDNLIYFGPNQPDIIDRHRNEVWQLMMDGIKENVVRPLHRTIFPANQAEEAFRYMATGKHTGKVIICIREEEKPDERGVTEIKTGLKIPAIPRTVFFFNKSYIVTGGLGGFGLELLDWMVQREARNFIVTSRSGIKDLYQKTRLKYLEQLGATIKIFTEDTSVEEGIEALVTEAESMGPVGGVFHLAMVLSDGLFDNQTIESFQAVLKPKSDTCFLLDKVTRKRCAEIDYFVAFSSVSCGFGNPGQTNYGYANSLMERTCDQRRRDGLHGFAIQWGAIGDVGYIIDNIRGNDIVVCGSVPQRMPSCLNSLDRLLQREYSVCANLIKSDFKFEAGGKTSLIKTVAHILGVKDWEKLDPKTTLGELGMDSLMGVEVKQAIERDYDVVLSMQDIRKLTVGRIIEIGEGQAKSEGGDTVSGTSQSIDDKLVPPDDVIFLNDIINGDPIIFLPQLDASWDELIPLAKKFNRPAIGINWTKQCRSFTSVPDTATYYIEVIEKTLPNLTTNYDMVGYSFGGIIGIEMGLQLQKRKSGKLGKYRKLVLLDSSPKQFFIFSEEAAKKFAIREGDEEQTKVETILMFVMTKMTVDYHKIKDMLQGMETWEKRIQFVRDLFKQYQNIELQTETIEFLIESHYNKMNMIYQYRCPEKELKSDVLLCRASDLLVSNEQLMRDDYFLGDIVDGVCEVHVLPGNHKTFITDNYDELTKFIRDHFEKK